MIPPVGSVWVVHNNNQQVAILDRAEYPSHSITEIGYSAVVLVLGYERSLIKVVCSVGVGFVSQAYWTYRHISLPFGAKRL